MIKVEHLKNDGIAIKDEYNYALYLNIDEGEQLWQNLMQVCQEYRIKEKQNELEL